MNINSIKNLSNLEGKTALLRVDFNVQVKNGKVVDDFRIQKSLPTIRFLSEKGAKLIIVSHLGRPKGKDCKLSLKPVARRLEKLLGKKIGFVNSVGTGFVPVLKKKIFAMRSGDVTMLENIRFNIDEEKNTGTLAKDLASFADIFVSECFAVAHRAGASISGVAEYLPTYAGFLMEDEISGLSQALEAPEHPLVVVLGGAKSETKIPILKNFLPKADYILIAGGIFSTYLWAKGYKVGSSLIQKELKAEVLKYCSKAKVVKPVDVVVGKKDGRDVRVVSLKNLKSKACPERSERIINQKSEAIYDVGPKTMQLFSKYIKSAKTLVWNGALGMFEVHPYEYGTYAMAHIFAARSKGKAFGVTGGGETVQALEQLGVAKDVDLVSTGGGAMLEFLGGKKLPGVEAVRMQKVSFPVKSK